MSHSGYTVTPSYSETAEGEVVTDFEIDSFGGYDSRYDDQLIYQNEVTGQTQHAFQDVELDEAGEFQSDDYLQTLIQSTEGLSEAIQWAEQGGLSEDIVNQLADVVDGDDLDALHEALAYVLDQFEEAGYEVESEEEYTEDSEDESDFLSDPDDIEIYNNSVFEALGGQQSYQALTSWAAENLPEESIAAYDAVFDRCSIQEMNQAVDWLREQYESANY